MGSPSGHVFLLLGSLFFWTEAGHGYLSQFVQGERSRASQLSLLAGLDGTRSSGTFEGFGVMWTVRWAPRGIAAPRSVIRGAFSQCVFIVYCSAHGAMCAHCLAKAPMGTRVWHLVGGCMLASWRSNSACPGTK